VGGQKRTGKAEQSQSHGGGCAGAEPAEVKGADLCDWAVE